jgi:hypothetical protein
VFRVAAALGVGCGGWVGGRGVVEVVESGDVFGGWVGEGAEVGAVGMGLPVFGLLMGVDGYVCGNRGAAGQLLPVVMRFLYGCGESNGVASSFDCWCGHIDLEFLHLL